MRRQGEAAPPPGVTAQDEGGSYWSRVLPLTFVVFALAALVVVPIAIQNRISTLRDEIIGVAEPTRSVAAEFALSLARERVLLREWQLLGGPSTADELQRVSRRTDQLFEYLPVGASNLGSEVSSELRPLVRSYPNWRDHVRAATAGGARAPSSFDPRLHAEVLAAASRVERALTRAVQQRFYSIREAERLESRLTLAAVVLALLAALAIFWIGHRMRVLAERAARRRAEVEALLEEKARLIRGISHDVKNPVGAIDGYAQLLEAGVHGELLDEQLASIARIRRNVNSVLRIINDLLEVSRVESGQLVLHMETIDVARLIRDTAEDYAAEMESAGLRFDVRIDPALPPIRTDADRVANIVGNLLSNAAKYARSGPSVTLEARLIEGAEKPARVVVSVVDEGPGIPAAARDSIFDEFTRLEPGVRRGSGVGLSISRRIARLMGGDIRVASEPGQGSTFSLWLPVAPAAGSDRPEDSRSAMVPA